MTSLSIDLTPQEWQLVIKGLDELQGKYSRALANKITVAIVKEASKKPEEEKTE